MPKNSLFLVGFTAAALAAVGVASAQQSDNPGRRPQQTHDKGIDDAVPPGQERKIGDRAIENVRLEARPDGTIVAFLDESFHDAVVATRKADGTVGYACLHGLPAADRQVKAHLPVKPTPAAPVLEEK